MRRRSGTGQEALAKCTVDLDALDRKDWENLCSKKCCAFTAGLCVHTLVALRKKDGVSYYDKVKEWEKLRSAHELYKAPFEIPNGDRTLKIVCHHAQPSLHS